MMEIKRSIKFMVNKVWKNQNRLAVVVQYVMYMPERIKVRPCETGKVKLQVKIDLPRIILVFLAL